MKMGKTKTQIERTAFVRAPIGDTCQIYIGRVCSNHRQTRQQRIKINRTQNTAVAKPTDIADPERKSKSNKFSFVAFFCYRAPTCVNCYSLRVDMRNFDGKKSLTK